MKTDQQVSTSLLPFLTQTYKRSIMPATLIFFFNISELEIKLLFNMNSVEVIILKKELEKIDLKKMKILLERNSAKKGKSGNIYWKTVKSLSDILKETNEVGNMLEKIEFSNFYDG